MIKYNEIKEIRKRFPILKKYVYLNSACMALKPYNVIEKIKEYYEKSDKEHNSNLIP